MISREWARSLGAAATAALPRDDKADGEGISESGKAELGASIRLYQSYGVTDERRASTSGRSMIESVARIGWQTLLN
jgi:hypothetical protein